MATLRKSDLTVFDSLSIVEVRGYKPEKQAITVTDPKTGVQWTEHSEETSIDLPGSADWLVAAYGMASSDSDPADHGILWTDYDIAKTWAFSVLLATGDVDNFKLAATEAGYEILKVEEVDEPCEYGDGHAGTVTILKHPDGWVLAE